VLTDAGFAAAGEIRRQEEVFTRSVLYHLPQGSAADALATLENLLIAVRSASESCCPGAYDHLVSSAQTSVTGGQYE